MENLKELKKGEVLFKEGQVVESFYLVKSGRFSLYQERSGHRVEVANVVAGQVLGEHGLYQQSKSLFTAESAVPSVVLEVSFKVLKPRVEGSDALMKLFLKGVMGLLHDSRGQVRSMKLEMDNSPCPQKMVARVFGLIGVLGNHFGKREADSVAVSWNSLRVYGYRMFLETVDRIRGALDLLQKLGYVEFQFSQTEEGESVLDVIKIKDPQFIEGFADFYQFHFYKSGPNEIIHVDPMAMTLAKALVELSEGLAPDFKGATQLPYEQLLSDLKARYRIDLKATHLDLLEKKGLLVQRKSQDKGLLLSIDRQEFAKVSAYWQIIHEIDQWNAKGFVDLEEKKSDEKSGGACICPDCQVEFTEGQKFCGNCGFKLVA